MYMSLQDWHDCELMQLLLHSLPAPAQASLHTRSQLHFPDQQLPLQLLLQAVVHLARAVDLQFCRHCGSGLQAPLQGPVGVAKLTLLHDEAQSWQAVAAAGWPRKDPMTSTLTTTRMAALEAMAR